MSYDEGNYRNIQCSSVWYAGTTMTSKHTSRWWSAVTFTPFAYYASMISAEKKPTFAHALSAGHK